MVTAVKRGLAAPLRRGDTVTIGIRGVDGGVPEALEPVWAALGTMGEYGEGPSHISEVLRIEQGEATSWMVMIDPKGLSSSEAADIPNMMAEALDAAGLDAEIGPQKGTDRFYDVRIENCVLIDITGPSLTHDERDAFSRLAARALSEILAAVSSEADAVLMIPEAIEVPWEFIRTQTDGGFLSDASPLCSLAAHNDTDPDGLWGRLSVASDRAWLALGGTSIANHDELGVLGQQLRLALRDLKIAPASTVITALPYFYPRRLNFNKIQGSYPFMGNRWRLNQRFLPALGWSSTMVTPIWDHVSAAVEASGANVEHLSDDRVEITFGELTEWAPWIEGTGARREATIPLMRAALADEDEYREALRQSS